MDARFIANLVKVTETPLSTTTPTPYRPPSDTVRDLDSRFNTNSKRWPILEDFYRDAHTELQSSALALLSAACSAATSLQRSLLTPGALSSDPGVPLHSIAASSRALALMWRSCAELGYGRVARHFEGLKLASACELCTLYADAASCAAEMLGGTELERGEGRGSLQGRGAEGAGVGGWSRMACKGGRGGDHMMAPQPHFGSERGSGARRRPCRRRRAAVRLCTPETTELTQTLRQDFDLLPQTAPQPPPLPQAAKRAIM